ncbi:MAG: matrixin family metalloprotease, partial [Hydrogenophaga sp.]|nr:matrixin family metalloprotease [Hydrogenophaga sp.]
PLPSASSSPRQSKAAIVGLVYNEMDLTSRILAGGGGAADRLKVQNALFRSDGQSTIPLVLFGDGSKNSYANVRSVLTNLGIKTTTSSGHQNHFHIYLKPPSLQAIVKPGGQNLLTNFEINEQINAATGDQTMMLDMNLPIPDDVLNPPALIAKVKVKFRDWGGVKASDEKGFKKVITSCTDVDGYADSLVIFDDVLAYLGYKADPETGVWSPPLEDKDLKFSVLQHPRHGTVGYGLLNGSSPETYGYLVRERKPDGTGAYQAPDRVVYLVEVKGQKFKVVINLLLGYSNDGPGGEVCVHHRFSLNEAPQGDLKHWSASVSLSGALADASGLFLEPHALSVSSVASSIQPVFSDLPGTALGLHEGGSGWNARITLDSNAAGHGWYVDATPWSVNDDYLPTSDPNLWLAKPGSGAEGKMDLLSVWLHELGHAAGLDHTASGAGLMGATLLPGQRRRVVGQR